MKTIDELIEDYDNLILEICVSLKQNVYYGKMWPYTFYIFAVVYGLISIITLINQMWFVGVFGLLLIPFICWNASRFKEQYNKLYIKGEKNLADCVEARQELINLKNSY